MNVKQVKENLDHYLELIKLAFPNYEERPEQYQMIRTILNGLYQDKHMLIEAGTGTGKSLAYILALLAVMKASDTKKRAIISTYTINLQQQLVEKDLPLLQQILDTDFRVAIAKGRGNYICQMRFMNVLSSLVGVFTSAEEALNFRDLLAEVYDGRKITIGDKAELKTAVLPSVWQEINSSQETCLEDNCPHDFNCIFRKARRELQKADFIVSNHALFFVDLMLRGNTESEDGGVLPAYDFIVFDEAHHVEDAAASAFSIEIKAKSLNQPVAWLQNILKRETIRQALTDSGYDLASVATINQHYFGQSAILLNQLKNLAEDQYAKRVFATELGAIKDTLAEPLSQLVDITKQMATRSELDDITALEIDKLSMNLKKVADEVDFVLNTRGEEYVYWVEGRQQEAAYAVPLNIAAMMKERIFECGKPVICTSATLAVPDMKFFAQRLGVDQYVSQIIFSSFDYQKQASLIVPSAAIVPDFRNLTAYERYVADTILEARAKVNGGIFALFTSYKMLDSVFSMVEAQLFSEGHTILKQGEMSRNILLQRFKKDGQALLFGTASFWEGVDVVGDDLRCVIITKLPFPVPDDPIAEARMERIKESGGNAFRDYMLPQAVLSFKQGFGRLIRSKTDTGLVIVTDQRLVGKYYGNSFIQSLPAIPLFREIEDISKIK